MLATTPGGHIVDGATAVHRIRWWLLLRRTGLKVYRFTVRRGRRRGCLAGRYVFSAVTEQNLLGNFPHLMLLLLGWHLNRLLLWRLASVDRFRRSLQHRSDDTLESILKVYYLVRVLQFCAWFRLDTRQLRRDDG